MGCKHLSEQQLKKRFRICICILLSVIIALISALGYVIYDNYSKSDKIRIMEQDFDERIAKLEQKLETANLFADEVEKSKKTISELEEKVQTQQATIAKLESESAKYKSEIDKYENQINQKNQSSNTLSHTQGGGITAYADSNNIEEASPKRNDTVYVTDTGKKYHKSGCQYLKDSKIAISLQEAIDRGYTACKKCY